MTRASRGSYLRTLLCTHAPSGRCALARIMGVTVVWVACLAGSVVQSGEVGSGLAPAWWLQTGATALLVTTYYSLLASAWTAYALVAYPDTHAAELRAQFRRVESALMAGTDIAVEADSKQEATQSVL